MYEDSDDEATPIRVLAAAPVARVAPDASGANLDRRVLPAVPRAVATVYRGSMIQVEDASRAMIRWADDAGERIVGCSREVYLECDGPPDTGVTKFEFALARPDSDSRAS